MKNLHYKIEPISHWNKLKSSRTPTNKTFSKLYDTNLRLFTSTRASKAGSNPQEPGTKSKAKNLEKQSHCRKTVAINNNEYTSNQFEIFWGKSFTKRKSLKPAHSLIQPFLRKKKLSCEGMVSEK